MGWGGMQKGCFPKGGKGMPKGCFGGKGRKPAPSVPDDFTIDPEARFKGKVTTFYKWHGYGFIDIEPNGLIPNDKLFVHWSNVMSTDRFPFLVKDQEVEFSIVKWVSGWGPNKTTSLRAQRVTQVGGGAISVQDQLDGEKKTFVGSQFARYRGTLKFYDPSRWFGYVIIDDGQLMGTDVPKEIRIEEAEVNCGGRRPKQKLENLKVEFGIVKNRRDNYLAYNMTLPGGIPITKANLEHRQLVDGAVYSGTVNFFNIREGWGFITPAPTVPLPPVVQQKLMEAMEKAREKGKAGADLYFAKLDCAPGFKPQPGAIVTFKLYVDDKGAGACDVSA